MKYLKIKRNLDIAFSIILIIILLPTLLSISIILLLKNKKIIFRQYRSGLNNEKFVIYKFNTINNEKIDPFCKFLRKTGLDELPQLFNILKGDMSFIGPRAWVTDYSKNFTNYQLKRLQVLPGITGYSQVSGRYKLSIFEKIEHDIYYVEHVNFLFDLKIFLKTFIIIFYKNNSYINNYQKEIETLKCQKYDFNPLVSIIIPNYNKEKYIEKCIKNVFNQTYDNFELIIIDDASTDKSLEIIEKFKTNKIKLIKLKQNKGIANARNIGINLSTGRMICFLDSDDYWDENKLKIQVEYMIRNNVGFSFTEYYFVRNNNIVGMAHTPHTLKYKQALKNTIIWTSTVMIDTAIIKKEQIKMPNVPRQDTACWFTILKKGYVAYSIDKPLSYYVRYNDSISANKLYAVKKTYDLYHKFLKFGSIKSCYYFSWYLFNTVKKRLCKNYKI